MLRKAMIAAVLATAAGLLGDVARAEEPTPASVPATAPVVPWTRFNIQYTVREFGGRGSQKVELYITDDMGQTWNLYGEDPDARSPMAVTVPNDGVYGFMTVGTDRAGNRERPPVKGTRPESIVIVDRTPPRTQWVAPNTSGMPPAGGIRLAWDSADSNFSRFPATIEYSTDNGKTWQLVRDRLPQRGEINWKPPVSTAGSYVFRLIVRDRAGNRVAHKNPYRILTDNVPPTAGITGPRQSGSTNIEITYAAADNDQGSGLEKVSLYASYDGGQTWTLSGDDADMQSPVAFTAAREGTVGLLLVATDAAGNTSANPVPGTPPAFTVVIDNEHPVVTMDPPRPDNRDRVRSGETVTLRWSAADQNLQANSGALELSLDNGTTWEPVISGLPVNQPYEWTVPRVNVEDAILRFSAKDQLGNTGAATSLPFVIEASGGNYDVAIRPVEEPGASSGPVSIDRGESGMIDGPAPSATTPLREDGMDNVRLPEEIVVPEIPGTEPPVRAPAPIAAVPPTPAITPDEPPAMPDESIPMPPIPGATDTSVPPMPTVSETATPTPPAVPTPTEMPPVAPPVVPTPSGAPDTAAPPPIATTPPLASAGVREVVETGAPPAATGSAAVDLNAGEEAFNNGDLETAATRAEKVLAAEPQNAAAHDLIGRIHYAKGEFAIASRYASKAVQANPNEPVYWHNLGEASYSQSRQLSRLLVSKRRSGTAGQAELARIAEQRDAAIESARNAFQKVTSLSTDQKKGWDRLGDTVYMQARLLTEREPETASQLFREAIDAYKKGHNIGKVTYRETFQLGVSYYRLFELDGDQTHLAKAQRYLEWAVEEAKADVHPKEAYWYLAEIHQKQNNLRDALRYWSEVIRMYPPGSSFRVEAERRLKMLNEILRVN